MNWKSLLIRIAVSLAMLLGLLLYISPEEILATVQGVDWRWLAAAGALMPVFLLSRIGKWLLLARQVAPDVRKRDVARGYLLGMALGIVTPGRVGEMARIWGAGLPASCYGLFFFEKVLEVTSLFSLSLLALISAGLLPAWVLAIALVCGGMAAVRWRKAFLGLAAFTHRHLKRPSADNLAGLGRTVKSLRISGCAILTVACQVLYCVQACLIMRSMDEAVNILVARLTPLVLLGNLVPITIGGVGARETIAVFLLRQENIAEGVAFNGFFLVAILNLFIPVLIGGIIYLTSEISVSLLSTPKSGGEEQPEILHD